MIRSFYGSMPVRMWLVTLLALIWFDVVWCLGTTFTPFSSVELWVNTLLLSLVLALPVMIWDCRKVQAIIVTLVCVWLECNLIYYRTYFSAIPPGSYLLVSNLGDFTASVTDSLRWPDAGFLLIILLAWTVRGRNSGKATRRGRRIMYAAVCVALAVISGTLIATKGGFRSAWKRLENANYHSCRVPMYTLVGSLVYDSMSAAETLTPELEAATREWLQANGSLAQLDSVDARSNMVLILCESLESWVIGLELEGKEITPNLNRALADTSATLYAPRVLTQVGNGRSIDAQLLVNAGMLPMVAGVYSMDRPMNRYLTLSDAFVRLNDARSYLLTVDKEITWNQGAVARAFGIDTVLARASWVNDEKVGSRKKLGDRSFMRQIAEKMHSGDIWPENGDENAFVQIVTYSGHNPFVLPADLDCLKLEGDYPDVLRNYLTMAHYTDEALGILIDYLRTRPDYDRTMVVITGDHEGLADYRASLAAGYPYVDSGQHTPFIVLNSPVPLRYDGVMGQVDMYPTLLQLSGLTDYSWHGMGKSILDPSFPKVAVGSQGNVEGSTDSIPVPVLRHLQTAREVSDRIIRFNLLDDVR